MPYWLDNSFFALVALVIFLALLGYFGVHKIIAKMLDGKIAQIEADIAEAKRLRAEAAALLAEYGQKRVAAEKEAEGIITAAREEAERLTAEAQASLADLVTRRTKAVEDKIAQAEARPSPKCAPAPPTSPSRPPAPCSPTKWPGRAARSWMPPSPMSAPS